MTSGTEKNIKFHYKHINLTAKRLGQSKILKARQFRILIAVLGPDMHERLKR